MSLFESPQILSVFWKIIKYIIVSVFILIIIGLLINLGFALIENQTGKKYVEYWKNNSEKYEQVGQNHSFTFAPLKNYFDTHNIILFGEAHGTEQAQNIDLQLIKHLNKEYGMQHHVAELDFSQAFFLNKYLKNGNDSLINYSLQKWSIEVGQENEGYYQKWRELYKYNLNEEKKINIIGIDEIQDFSVTQRHVELLLAQLNITAHVPGEKEDIIRWAKKDLPEILELINKEDINIRILKDLKLIQNNLLNYNTKSRVKLMKDNFLAQYNRYNLKDKKIYAYLGFFHVLQEKTTYADFPVLLANSGPYFKNNIFSLVTLLSGSYIPMPSKELPFFIRDKEEYTKFSFPNDMLYILYFYGIKDLIKITDPKTNTLFVLEGQGSPYQKSLRLIDNTGIVLSGPEIHNKNSVTTDYYQAVVLIRDSDWTRP